MLVIITTQWRLSTSGRISIGPSTWTRQREPGDPDALPDMATAATAIIAATTAADPGTLAPPAGEVTQDPDASAPTPPPTATGRGPATGPLAERLASNLIAIGVPELPARLLVASHDALRLTELAGWINKKRQNGEHIADPLRLIQSCLSRKM